MSADFKSEVLRPKYVYPTKDGRDAYLASNGKYYYVDGEECDSKVYEQKRKRNKHYKATNKLVSTCVAGLGKTIALLRSLHSKFSQPTLVYRVKVKKADKEGNVVEKFEKVKPSNKYPTTEYDGVEIKKSVIGKTLDAYGKYFRHFRKFELFVRRQRKAPSRRIVKVKNSDVKSLVNANIEKYFASLEMGNNHHVHKLKDVFESQGLIPASILTSVLSYVIKHSSIAPVDDGKLHYNVDDVREHHPEAFKEGKDGNESNEVKQIYRGFKNSNKLVELFKGLGPKAPKMFTSNNHVFMAAQNALNSLIHEHTTAVNDNGIAYIDLLADHEKAKNSMKKTRSAFSDKEIYHIMNQFYYVGLGKTILYKHLKLSTKGKSKSVDM